MTVSLPIKPWGPGLPPGVYEERPAPARVGMARLDLATFIGLAERGPLHTPVDVPDWPSFRRVFGGRAPGLLLPEAVRLFFRNGGQRCLVVRCLDHAATHTRSLALPGLVVPPAGTDPWPPLAARNPGAWASGLRLRLTLQRRPTPLQRPSPSDSTLLATAGSLQVGNTLSLLAPRPATAGDPTPAPQLVHVASLEPCAAGQVRVGLSPMPAGDRLARNLLHAAQRLEVTLEIRLDGRLVEQWPRAGLHPDHPRFLPRLLGRRAASEALRPPRLPTGDSESPADEVDRLWGGPEEPWGSEYLRPSARLLHQVLSPSAELLASGEAWSLPPGDAEEGPWEAAWRELSDPDGALVLGREHFFEATSVDPAAARADADDRFLAFGDRPGPFSPSGALTRWDEAHPLEPAALICLPDLLHPAPAESDTPSLQPPPPSHCFSEQCEPPVLQPNTIHRRFPRLRFDPEDLRAAQERLVRACEERGQGIALLDLPLRLQADRISPLRAAERMAWVGALRSERAALYTPWLGTERHGTAVEVGPAAVAAGLIARLEREEGVWRAPANVVAQGVFTGLEAVDEALAGALHEERIDALRRTPAGLTLLGSRTTSADPSWTHLSVRRLIDWLKLQIAAELAWAPFEPNGPELWAAMAHTARRRLRQVYNAGGLAGQTETDSFFVRCDAGTSTAADRDAGRAVLLVGVAPAVPAEFLVFRLLRRGGNDPGLEVV